MEPPRTGGLRVPQEEMDALLRLIEGQLPGVKASLLLATPDGQQLRDAAGPSLPASYRSAIDGLSIGPAAGSCGTAAFRRAQVVVSDIASDPLWDGYHHLAATHHLAACWSTPILGSDNRLLGTFALYYDHPRIQEAGELALIESAAMLARAIIESAEAESERERLVGKLEAANIAKSDFLATMSHELRTPLNAMIGYSSLLMEGIPDPLPESARGNVERIGLSARHLLELIEEILTFSRLEAGHEEVTMEPLDLCDLVREAAAISEPLAAGKGLEFSVEIADSPVPMETDARKVRQILINLVGNAVKFTPRGRISIRAYTAGDLALIEVADTGRGIPADHLERIFEPFVQLEGENSSRAAGTGLGLTVCRRYARLMGGDLHVESTPGSGSTFALRLPMRRPRPGTADAV